MELARHDQALLDSCKFENRAAFARHLGASPARVTQVSPGNTVTGTNIGGEFSRAPDCAGAVAAAEILATSRDRSSRGQRQNDASTNPCCRQNARTLNPSAGEISRHLRL
jgi:hypothetical protein